MCYTAPREQAPWKKRPEQNITCVVQGTGRGREGDVSANMKQL